MPDNIDANIMTISESIVNGQRVQAWEQMIEYNINLDELGEEIGLAETLTMFKVGVHRGFIVVKEKNDG